MLVEFEAVDRAGQSLQDTIEADDVRSAVDQLRKRDLIVTRAAPTGSGSISRSKPKEKKTEFSKVRMKGKDLTMFTRQMAMLLKAGSSVVPALQSVAQHFTKPPLKKLIERIAADLEEGATLATAIRKYPDIFNSSYCAIIAAGEASAQLTEMFTRLANIVGERRAMRNKVIGAMAYPVLLTGLSSGIIMVLLFFVLPRFSIMFETLNVPLPTTTEMLLGLSANLREHWIAFVSGFLAISVATTLAVTKPAARSVIGEIAMRIPMLGGLLSGLIQGEMFRVMGMLVEAKVGLLDAIDLARGITTNGKYQKLFKDMESEVTTGGSVSDALENSGLIQPYVCHAVRTGEGTGQLGASLTYVADVLDEDNGELINTVTKLMEPMILIVMGVVVGTVSLSLFTPMFDMATAAGG